MNDTLFKVIRIILSAVLIISLFITLEFGLLLIKSLIPELSDGIPAPGTVFQFYFGEDGWSRTRYFEFLTASAYTAFFSASFLLILSVFVKKGRRR